jgi:ATP-dependent DNA helicase UvrD/PcrA
MLRAKKKPLKRRVKPFASVKAASKKMERQANSPPPDITPMPRSSYSTGTAVSHPQFGHGVVTAIDGDKLTIKFADGRVKQIIDYYVKPRP